jgi:hypothetical protein
MADEPSLRWRTVPGRAGTLGWLILLLSLGCARPPVTPTSLVLTDLDGRASPLQLAGTTRAVVFVFLGVECPIANRSLPELASLETRLAPRGIVFHHLYPNPDETPERIREHRREFSLSPVAFRDPGLRIAEALKACRTPEAVALTPDGRLIYQGRVNDQFTALGVGRPEPTRHDLAEALESFLTGAAPAGVITPGVGCTFRGTP